VATTCIERNWLLSEVNRLTALVKPPRGQKSDWFDHGWAIGKASENARILAAVEALRGKEGWDGSTDAIESWDHALDAVLALLEGES
jgi:hypothetical protein